jgi:hypothetical protein
VHPVRWLVRNLARRVLPGERPPGIDPRDVIVASYPRSGSTWVRFLLANLLLAPDGPPVDFHSLGELVPDLHLPEHWPAVRSAHPPRLLKTHDLPARRFRRAIYVLRDGRDVAVSHYLYLRHLRRFDGSFLAFLESRKLGPARWARHAMRWLRPSGRRRLLTVRYEDLVDEPARELRRMAEFAELPHGPVVTDWAVRHSTFDAMRRLQETSGRPHDNAEGFVHVRRGAVGEWRQWFEQAHSRAFNRHAGEVLRRLGYTDHGAA